MNFKKRSLKDWNSISVILSRCIPLHVSIPIINGFCMPCQHIRMCSVKWDPLHESVTESVKEKSASRIQNLGWPFKSIQSGPLISQWRSCTDRARLSQSSPILDVRAVGPRCQIIWVSSTWLVCCCIPVHAGEEVMAIRRASLGNVIMSFPGFPDGSAGEESTCDAGDTGNMGLIPGSGRSPGRGNGNPL